MYYGSATSGQFWKPLCTEYYFTGAGGCRLPPSILNFINLNRTQTSGAIGE